MSEGGNITRTIYGTSHKEAESIHIVATKENLEFTSPDEVRFHGKDGGKKLGDYDAKNTTLIKVTKVEGPFNEKGEKVTKIGKDKFYTYKATTSKTPTKNDIKLLQWAIKIDKKSTVTLLGVSALNHLEDNKIIIRIKVNEEFESARIYAFYEKPIDSVSVLVAMETELLQHIIVIGTQNHRGDSSFTNPISWFADVGSGSKLMFAMHAVRRLRLNKDIKFSVLMCKEGYKASHINEVKEAVIKLYGGKFYEVNSAQQIINYINTGETDNTANISSKRKEKPVKQLLFYAHGLVGKLALGMGLTGDSSAYSFGENEVSKLNKEAFTSQSHIYSFACRTGLGNPDIDKSIYKQQIKSSTSIGVTSMGIPLSNDEFETVQMPLYSAQSIAQKLSNQTNALVYAFLRRSDYEETFFTKDELAFSDYMQTREGNKNVTLSPKRYGDKYKYLLDTKYKLTTQEEKRWKDWKEIVANMKLIDKAYFDPDGARHNIKAAPSPVGVPAEMQTFKPK